MINVSIAIHVTVKLEKKYNKENWTMHTYHRISQQKYILHSLLTVIRETTFPYIKYSTAKGKRPFATLFKENAEI